MGASFDLDALLTLLRFANGVEPFCPRRGKLKTERLSCDVLRDLPGYAQRFAGEPGNGFETAPRPWSEA